MIALCRVHADQADGGAFTDDQLRELKREGRERAEAIRGEFNWMRRDLLAIVGGNFYPNPRIILEVGGRPLVWFDRDEDGNLLLNFWMLSSDGSRRARILGNVWIVPPDVADLECPHGAGFSTFGMRTGTAFGLSSSTWIHSKDCVRAIRISMTSTSEAYRIP